MGLFYRSFFSIPLVDDSLKQGQAKLSSAHTQYQPLLTTASQCHSQEVFLTVPPASILRNKKYRLCYGSFVYHFVKGCFFLGSIPQLQDQDMHLDNPLVILLFIKKTSGLTPTEET